MQAASLLAVAQLAGGCREVCLSETPKEATGCSQTLNLSSPCIWAATKSAAPQMPEGLRPVCIQSRFMLATMRSAVFATCTAPFSEH